MGYRGRLIWPIKAKISRLDTAATKANTGTQPSGYDRVFREPVKFTSGDDSRVYRDPVMVACQSRDRVLGPYDRLEQFAGGRVLNFRYTLVAHYKDLEALGLVDGEGRCSIQVSDRLDALYENDATTLIRTFEETPLYCVQVQDRSFGLSGLKRNLVNFYFDDRETASR